jgi:hypothetical protein
MHLREYKRAERLDLDDWLDEATGELIRCNRKVRIRIILGIRSYQSCLYSILSIVMPLRATVYDAWPTP